MSERDVLNATNRDEANRARELGLEALRAANTRANALDQSDNSVVVHQYKRAIRMFEVSLRLHQNPSVEDDLRTARAGLARVEAPDSSSGSTNPRTWNVPNFYPNIPSRTQAFDFFERIRRSRCCPCILPQYRSAIFLLFSASLIIFVYRLLSSASFERILVRTLGMMPNGIVLSIIVMVVQKVLFGRDSGFFFFAF